MNFTFIFHTIPPDCDILEKMRKMKTATLSKSIFLFSIIFVFAKTILTQLYARDTAHELIIEGSACNNYFLYEDAIKYLNEAIKIQSSEKEAYRERAFSYFELNKIDLALKDYYHVLYLSSPSKTRCINYSISESCLINNNLSSLDFARGLLYGTLLGGKEETIEFIASIRGGLSFLWAFACSPIDVSKELIDSLYAMGEFLAHAKIYKLLENALPELRECREYWDTWSDYMKGQKMGFIIGKYSIAAFYYVTAWKGTSYYNRLRRANIMTTLERCSVSKGTRILEESAKRASKNTLRLKKAFNGTVIPHNPNVVPHVMQKKHRWDKHIRLSGNRSEDFKKVVAFLEEIEILKCERQLDFAFENIKIYFYRKKMEKDTIVAMFDVNKKGMPLLKNAWVEPNPPFTP